MCLISNLSTLTVSCPFPKLNVDPGDRAVGNRQEKEEITAVKNIFFPFKFVFQTEIKRREIQAFVSLSGTHCQEWQDKIIHCSDMLMFMGIYF